MNPGSSAAVITAVPQTPLLRISEVPESVMVAAAEVPSPEVFAAKKKEESTPHAAVSATLLAAAPDGLEVSYPLSRRMEVTLKLTKTKRPYMLFQAWMKGGTSKRTAVFLDEAKHLLKNKVEFARVWKNLLDNGLYGEVVYKDHIRWLVSGDKGKPYVSFKDTRQNRGFYLFRDEVELFMGKLDQLVSHMDHKENEMLHSIKSPSVTTVKSCKIGHPY